MMKPWDRATIQGRDLREILVALGGMLEGNEEWGKMKSLWWFPDFCLG